MSFKSESEINKLYTDHLESLLMWGGEFDEAGLRDEWQRALDEFNTQ